jgi:hypothetical protein
MSDAARDPSATAATELPITLVDGRGPRWLSRARWLVPFVALVGAFVAPPPFESSFAIGAWFTFVAALAFPPRFRPKKARLVLGRGKVTLRGAGLLGQTLRARDLLGVTTARTDEGFHLVATRKTQDRRPIVLTVASLAELRAVLDALGVGEDGFGTVRFGTTPRALGLVTGLAGAVMTVTAAIAFVETALGRFLPDALDDAVLATTISAFFLSIWGILALIEKVADGEVALRDVGVGTSANRRVYPWAAIDTPRLEGADLVFWPRGAPQTAWAAVRVGLDDDARAWFGAGKAERGVLAAVVEAAARRAMGEGDIHRVDGSAVAHLRRNGESLREWLARLDGVAASLAGGAFRGGSIDTKLLQDLLADPGADGELRIAAGRILAHLDLDEARVRIDDAVAKAHDPTEAARLRVALTGADGAEALFPEAPRAQAVPWGPR